jgi:hypothetical protein
VAVLEEGYINWCLLNYSEGQTCPVNWAAAQTISNALLAGALILITAYYAIQTHGQVKAMQDQVNAMQNQVKVMQDQLSFERTFRPRLDAYKRFTDIMSFRPTDGKYIVDHIVPELKLILPYSSNDTKIIAKKIYGSAFTEGKVNFEITKSNFVDQINDSLIPKLEKEIVDITQSESTMNYPKPKE